MIFGASLGSASWYLARGTGVVSLLLFTVVMMLGLLGQQRFSAPRWPRFAIDALHRDISLLAVALLAVHIVTSILDGYAPIGLADAVIPFGSPYRPLWLGLGALSFDLMLAVVATSLLRRRIGLAGWRAVHWLAYLSWPVAVLHGLGTGSDAKQWWNLALTGLCVVAVAGALLVRITRGGAAGVPRADSAPEGGPGARTLAITATLLTCLGIAVFTLAGPLQHGWAKRAGTPGSLLGANPTASVARPVRVSAQVVPFIANLSGTLRSSYRPGGEVLDFTLAVTGGARGELRMRIAGRPLSGGGVSMVGSQVELAVAGLSQVAQGRIVALDGSNLIARVAATRGTIELRIGLNGAAGGGGGLLTGTVQAIPRGSG